MLKSTYVKHTRTLSSTTVKSSLVNLHMADITYHPQRLFAGPCVRVYMLIGLALKLIGNFRSVLVFSQYCSKAMCDNIIHGVRLGYFHSIKLTCTVVFHSPVKDL